ncbi:MAG: hypothetical protein HZA03_03590 [Nitrospinae bacterium]|nr:hypothetical protein [Nitrospinota bacterium]
MKSILKARVAVFLAICVFAISDSASAFDLFKKKAPKCGDEEVKKTVIGIIKKNPDGFIFYKKGEVRLDFIRATGFDKEIGSYQCSARVKGKDAEVDIVYEVSINEEEEEEGGYIVEVREAE